MIHFLFARELKIRIPHCLWLHLTFSHSSVTSLWMLNTINICVERTFQNKRKVKALLKRHFKQFLTHAVKSLCFIFNDIYYKQIDSVAMGSPLGPTFANLFFVSYEHEWLENCP